MAEAVSVVDSGVAAAADAGNSILKIVGMVGELAESMDEISWPPLSRCRAFRR